MGGIRSGMECHLHGQGDGRADIRHSDQVVLPIIQTQDVCLGRRGVGARGMARCWRGVGW